MDNKFVIVEHWKSEEEADKDVALPYVAEYVKEMGDSITVKLTKLNIL